MATDMTTRYLEHQEGKIVSITPIQNSLSINSVHLHLFPEAVAGGKNLLVFDSVCAIIFEYFEYTYR